MDDNSHGFQLESSLLRNPNALSRLCLVLALTTLYLVAQGTQVVATNKRRWSDPHWFRGNSYLRIGWQWVKTALSHGWALFTTLRLNGTPDPDPALASLRQSCKLPPLKFTVAFFDYSP